MLQIVSTDDKVNSKLLLNLHLLLTVYYQLLRPKKKFRLRH